MHVARIDCTGGRAIRAVRLPGAEYVALGLVVPAGFATDPPHAAGTAHHCEHVATRVGASAVPHAPVIMAHTSCHTTLFAGEALSDDLERAVSAFTAIVSDSTEPSPEMIAQERSAIGIEMEIAASMPLSGVGSAVCAALAPWTGLGAEHAASQRNMHQVEAHHIREFRASHYRADRAVLVAAGDVDLARLDELADMAGLCRQREAPSGAGHERPPGGPVPDAEVWGVAFVLAGAELTDVPGWVPAVEAGLTGGHGVVRTASTAWCGPPAGTATLRCRNGWITLAAWRGEPARRTFTGLTRDLRSTVDTPRVVERIRQHDLAERGRLCVPTAARDALLGQVAGTGPSWERLSEEFDPVAAAQRARAMLAGATWWRIRHGVIDIVEI